MARKQLNTTWLYKIKWTGSAYDESMTSEDAVEGESHSNLTYFLYGKEPEISFEDKQTGFVTVAKTKHIGEITLESVFFTEDGVDKLNVVHTRKDNGFTFVTKWVKVEHQDISKLKKQ